MPGGTVGRAVVHCACGAFGIVSLNKRVSKIPQHIISTKYVIYRKIRHVKRGQCLY